MSKIKEENYLVIGGWMINRLNLKGNDLLAFALIYGFTQDGESEFEGGLSYVCAWLGGVSKPTARKALRSLEDSGLIVKREEEVMKGVVLNRWKVDLEVVKNFDGGSKETLLGGSKETLFGGDKETLPNNTNTDINSLDKNSDRKGTPDLQKNSLLFPVPATEQKKKKVASKKKKAWTMEEKRCNFRESKFFDLDDFLKAFEGTDYAKFVDLVYYYHALLDWSDKNMDSRTKGKAIDWIATARTFIKGDTNSNKLKVKEGVHYGNSNTREKGWDAESGANIGGYSANDLLD